MIKQKSTPSTPKRGHKYTWNGIPVVIHRVLSPSQWLVELEDKTLEYAYPSDCIKFKKPATPIKRVGLKQTESGGEAKPFKVYRTKEIKKVSTRQQKLNIAYSAQRKVFLKNHPHCGVGHFCCTLKATDIHHKAGRGEYLLDESTWLQVCRSCHSFIELSPEWAKEKGFSVSRLSKGV